MKAKKCAYPDEEIAKPPNQRLRFIEQYSSSYTAEGGRIVTRVTSGDPSLRILVTTVAMGMGVDMKAVDRVIHWGAPNTLLQYWQEVGRAGRDGRQAYAIMYAVRISLVHADKAVKEFVEKVTSSGAPCIRKELLPKVSLNVDEIDVPERCCTVCDLV